MSTEHYLDKLTNKGAVSGAGVDDVSKVYPYHDPAFGAGWRLREQNKDPVDYKLQMTPPDLEPPLSQLLQQAYAARRNEEESRRLQRALLNQGAGALDMAHNLVENGSSGVGYALKGEMPTIGLPAIQDGGMHALFSVFDGPASPDAPQHAASRYGAHGPGTGVGGPGGPGYGIGGQPNPNAATDAAEGADGSVVPFGFGDQVNEVAAGGCGRGRAHQGHPGYKAVEAPLGFKEIRVNHPAWVSVEPEAGVRGLAWWLA